MSALAELDAPHTIEPTVNYLVNDGAEIFNYTGGPGSTEVKSGGTLDPHQVTIHNARPHLAEFKLDVHGFRYARHDTKMKNFMDADEIKRVYYPEVERLVRDTLSASRVIVFDHNVRNATRPGMPVPSRQVHNDHTVNSAPRREIGRAHV